MVFVSLFRSTLPLRGATLIYKNSPPQQPISIHAPLAGSDLVEKHILFPTTNFDPRSPCGERPFDVGRPVGCSDISIHAPLAGSDWSLSFRELFDGISIHAPLAGSDNMSDVTITMCPHFDPRSPCGERPEWWTAEDDKTTFRSTLPLRGATTLCRELAWVRDISIHAPLAGSDFSRVAPNGNATFISIHAPLAGSDLAIHNPAFHRADFDPRSPCGERLYLPTGWYVSRDFDPRSPCGERLPGFPHATVSLYISIHAPLAGSDANDIVAVGTISAFRSTLPLRGATPTASARLGCPCDFDPRSPCGERLGGEFQAICVL